MKKSRTAARALVATLGAAVLLAGVMATPAFALLVQPILIELKSSGAGSNSQIRVVNDRARPVTVEVTVQKLDIPATGDVAYTPDPGDDFLIFPPTATIQPGKTQIFRVRWVGEPVVDRSRFFMFSTTELPIDLTGESKAAVQLLYSISTVVTVAPPQGAPDLKVVAVERGVNGENKPGVRLTVANASPVHGVLSRAHLKLRSAGYSKELDPSLVGSGVGIGIVPPDSQRTFFVPVEGVPATGDLSAELDLSPRIR